MASHKELIVAGRRSARLFAVGGGGGVLKSLMLRKQGFKRFTLTHRGELKKPCFILPPVKRNVA